MPNHYNQKIYKNRRQRINTILISSICGTLVFVTSFAYIYLNSKLIQTQHNLKSAITSWQKDQSKFNELTSQLAKVYNLDVIENKAINELFMHKPMAHQIVYIDVGEESFTRYDK